MNYYCSACDAYLREKRQCAHTDCKAIPVQKVQKEASKGAQSKKLQPLAKAS